MSDFTVEADYANFQFQVQKDGKFIDLKLPAEVQAAMIIQVQKDFKDDVMKMLESPDAILKAMAKAQCDGLI